MKDYVSGNRLIKVLFAAVAISTSMAIATEESRPRLTAGRLDFSPAPHDWPVFKIGAMRRMVVEIAGLPDARLSSDVWIYFDWKKQQPDARLNDFNTLVITFQRDRVSALKLTDRSALLSFVAQHRLRLLGPSYADLLREP